MKHGSVGRSPSTESVALDDTGESFALRRSNYIDMIAGGKKIHLQFLADLAGLWECLYLPENSEVSTVSRTEVTLQRFRKTPLFHPIKTQLNRFITVFFPGSFSV